MYVLLSGSRMQFHECGNLVSESVEKPCSMLKVSMILVPLPPNPLPKYTATTRIRRHVACLGATVANCSGRDPSSG